MLKALSQKTVATAKLSPPQTPQKMINHSLKEDRWEENKFFRRKIIRKVNKAASKEAHNELPQLARKLKLPNGSKERTRSKIAAKA